MSDPPGVESGIEAQFGPTSPKFRRSTSRLGDVVDDPNSEMITALAGLFDALLRHQRETVLAERQSTTPLPDTADWQDFVASLGSESDRAIPVIFSPSSTAR